MYIFHGNLEAIETTSFCDLYFLTEPLHLEEINVFAKAFITELQVRDIDAVYNSSCSAHRILYRLIPDMWIINSDMKSSSPSQLQVVSYSLVPREMGRVLSVTYPSLG